MLNGYCVEWLLCGMCCIAVRVCAGGWVGGWVRACVRACVRVYYDKMMEKLV